MARPAPQSGTADQSVPPTINSTRADYTAFKLLHHRHYVQYAQIRIGEERLGRRVADAAFEHVAAAWPEILASPCPAADAWRILGQAVTDTGLLGPEGSFHRMLPPAQADTLLLHRQLGMTPPHAAALMGISVELVAANLATADRTLASHYRT